MEQQTIQVEIPLPDELLSEMISKFIPMCYWSSCLEYVSKQFRNCVLIAYGRIKSLNFRKLFSQTRSIRHWDSLGREHLLFSWENSTSARLNNMLTKLLTVCPYLTEVDGFEYMVSTVSGGTWTILKECDRFESISLNVLEDKIPFVHFANFVDRSKSLKKLKISHCHFDVDAATLLAGTLTSVDISGTLCVDMEERKPIFLENLSENLTSLTMCSFERAIKHTYDFVEMIKMCTNLQHFSVCLSTKDHNYDYRTLLNILPYLCKLTSLHISVDHDYQSSLTFDNEFCIQMDSLKNQLQSVEFLGMNLSDEVQNFMFTKCTTLKSLKLAYHKELNATALKNVHSLPESLKEISFPDTNGQILPLLLPNLVQLSNLTALHISGRDFSSEWENICYLKNMLHLHVYGGLNDSLLDKWDKKNEQMFEKLISLEIRGCDDVTDTGACIFAKKVKNLQKLDLSHCGIGNKTFLALADVAKNVTKACFVHYQSHLYDENALVHFVRKSVRLKKLELDEIMAYKVVEHCDFLPVLENIEININ